jgi:hypothetical protein
MYHIYFYSSILGCQVQSFFALISLLSTNDIWLACWLLVPKLVSYLIPTSFHCCCISRTSSEYSYMAGAPGWYVYLTPG